MPFTSRLLFSKTTFSRIGPLPFIRKATTSARMVGSKHGPRDPNTLSNYDEFRTTHTVAHLNIDFAKKQLSGSLSLTLKVVGDTNADEIVLDTSYLDIKDVRIGESSTDWVLLPRTTPYGSALKIKTASTEPGQSVTLVVGDTSRRQMRCPAVEQRKLTGSRSTSKPRTSAPLCNGSLRRRLRTRSIPICVSYLSTAFVSHCAVDPPGLNTSIHPSSLAMPSHPRPLRLPLPRHPGREVDLRVQHPLAAAGHRERAFYRGQRLPAGRAWFARQLAVHVQAGRAHSQLLVCFGERVGVPFPRLPGRLCADEC